MNPVTIRPSDLMALDNLEIAAFAVRDLCEDILHQVMAQDPACGCSDDAVDAAYDMLTRFQELCQEIADTVGDVREVTDA